MREEFDLDSSVLRYKYKKMKQDRRELDSKKHLIKVNKWKYILDIDFEEIDQLLMKFFGLKR